MITGKRKITQQGHVAAPERTTWHANISMVSLWSVLLTSAVGPADVSVAQSMLTVHRVNGSKVSGTLVSLTPRLTGRALRLGRVERERERHGSILKLKGVGPAQSAQQGSAWLHGSAQGVSRLALLAAWRASSLAR
jgi:hypothetical protein